ncbi:MAG: glycosyltransferase family 2 protein [Deltaproteobacteria bacterium]|nr:glycosyltransferase family 2 protein [Deltaproteobacteria bacterium]
MLKLSIIIPAYNEEDAIGDIIGRCLSEKRNIINKTSVLKVEIIVVDDGSRDKTAEIVKGYGREVKLITFEKNRGYGAALKAGFEEASGDLVSFLDADGTCNPKFFIDLCNKLTKENADIAIGSRLGAGNSMPLLRRVGNKAYVMLINLIGRMRITDSASGMRVLRKDCLPRIYPLPDGLHFTPAMSCRAVMDENIKIVEVPISYQERKGESKLSVIQDGVRFLKTIIDIALIYEPLRFFGSMGIIFLLIALGYGVYPLFFYLKMKIVPSYMIYRIITITALVFTSFTMFTIGIISEQIADFMMGKRREKGFFKKLIYSLFSQKKLIIVGPLISLSGILLNYQTIWQYFSMGKISVHWVYIVTGAFLFLTGLQALALGVLERILLTLKRTTMYQRRYLNHLKQQGQEEVTSKSSIY